MAEAIRANPECAGELHEAGGARLFSQVGSDVYLRADGAVWFRQHDFNDPSKVEWHEAKDNERLAALVVGSRRMPELKALLPVRPAGTPDCTTCRGFGEISFGKD